MATTTDLGNVNIFSSLASFNSNKANLKSNDLNFIKQTAAEMAVVGGGIVAQLLAANGYIKFANGLILQWGLNVNTRPVVFPITFTEVYTCVASYAGTDSGSKSNYDYQPTTLTNTGFTQSSNDAKYYGPVRFVAIGV